MLFFVFLPYLGAKKMQDNDERTALCALNRVLGYQPVTGHLLMEHFGSAAAVFRQDPDTLREALGADRALAEQLTPRERDIIKMFFGIGCQEMTLEEIGAKFNLTRERVRQIKEKAIHRLRGQKSQLLISYLG